MNGCSFPIPYRKSGRRNSGAVAVSTPFYTNAKITPKGWYGGTCRPTLALLGAADGGTGIGAPYFTPRAAGNSRKACCTDLAGRVRYATGVFSTWGSTAR